jgi:hypothetical protein
MDQFAIFQPGNSGADRRTADIKLIPEFILRWQLAAGRVYPIEYALDQDIQHLVCEI